jgi:hypothetical protein
VPTSCADSMQTRPLDVVVIIQLVTILYLLPGVLLGSSEIFILLVDWYLVTDVSGQLIGPIFKGQAVREERGPLKDTHYL